MDATDMIDYNLETLNKSDMAHSFFQMSRDDPTVGFEFDATTVAGHTYPQNIRPCSDVHGGTEDLTLRLRLGSHVALHMRQQLEQHKGYTATVGIATNKLLSKLVGNLNKPNGQTTLMPPPGAGNGQLGNVANFMDDHEIGKVPGIGFKLAQKLREFILQRPADFDAGLVYGGTRERVTVADARNNPEINFEKLEKLLGGPGSPHGIGYKVWCLLHGVDDTEVSQARPIPRQISIEDSYIRLDTMPELLGELTTLARSLIKRMRIDLLGYEEEVDGFTDTPPNDAQKETGTLTGKKWLAHPKTLRLTTRPRQPLQPDGTRVRSFKRISSSGPLPTFVFSLQESVDVLSDKLVSETLVGMFRKLHPEKAGWNLSLVNLAVTNMAETAGESKTANGRDISNMFKRQEDVLKDFTITEEDAFLDVGQEGFEDQAAAESLWINENESDEDAWDEGDGTFARTEFCQICASHIPAFAMIAHRRFHSPP